MRSSIYFITSLFIINFAASTSSHAQAYFLSICHNPLDSNSKNDIGWFKKLLHTDSCTEIANFISQQKSFTEILPPTLKNPLSKDTWPYQLPHYLGLNADLDNPNSISYKNLQARQSRKKEILEFKNINALTEFTNLKHIDTASFKRLKGVCEVVSMFPALESISISPEELQEKGVDDCIYDSKINVFLRYYDAESANSALILKSKIIGIESWRGDFKKLTHFTFLKYLDVSMSGGLTQSLEALALLSNLTHLSMTIPSLKFLYGIGDLENIQFLSLHSTINPDSETPGPSFIDDINFVKDLTFLKHINLNNNSVSDISPLLSLKYLQTIQLEKNELKSVPDLSTLKNLETLNLSYNSITSVKNISKAPALRILKLTSNQISDLSPLSGKLSLTHLDLSLMGNPTHSFQLPYLKNLTVLAINGFRGRTYELGNFEENIHKAFLDYSYQKLEDIRFIAKENFYKSFSLCTKASGYIEEVTGFENVPNLEVLMMYAQSFTDIPNISNLKSLKYLDYSYNLQPLKIDLINYPNLMYVNAGKGTIEKRRIGDQLEPVPFVFADMDLTSNNMRCGLIDPP